MRIAEKPINQYPWPVQLILWAQSKKYGKSLLPTKIWGRSPKVLYGLQALYRAIDRKSSPLEPALRSLINVMVSQINSCSFCVDISTQLLQKRGVSLEKISKLENFENESLFTAKEKIALSYAEAITRYDLGVSPDLFFNLKKHFNDDEIVELTALIGYQNLSSKFNAALDIPSQGFCLALKANSSL